MGVEDLNPIYKTHLISKLSSSRTSTNSLTLHPIINSMIQTSLSSTPHLTVPKRFHFAHSHCHHDEHYGRVETDQVFRLGVAADIALASGKVLTGNLSRSTAIIVDAAHSLSDVACVDATLALSRTMVGEKLVLQDGAFKISVKCLQDSAAGFIRGCVCESVMSLRARLLFHNIAGLFYGYEAATRVSVVLGGS